MPSPQSTCKFSASTFQPQLFSQPFPPTSPFSRFHTISTPGKPLLSIPSDSHPSSRLYHHSFTITASLSRLHCRGFTVAASLSQLYRRSFTATALPQQSPQQFHHSSFTTAAQLQHKIVPIPLKASYLQSFSSTKLLFSKSCSFPTTPLHRAILAVKNTFTNT